MMNVDRAQRPIPMDIHDDQMSIVLNEKNWIADQRQGILDKMQTELGMQLDVLNSEYDARFKRKMESKQRIIESLQKEIHSLKEELRESVMHCILFFGQIILSMHQSRNTANAKYNGLLAESENYKTESVELREKIKVLGMEMDEINAELEKYKATLNALQTKYEHSCSANVKLKQAYDELVENGKQKDRSAKEFSDAYKDMESKYEQLRTQYSASSNIWIAAKSTKAQKAEDDDEKNQYGEGDENFDIVTSNSKIISNYEELFSTPYTSFVSK